MVKITKGNIKMNIINIDYYWNKYYELTFVNNSIILQKKTLNLLRLCFNDGISTVLDYIDNSDNPDITDFKLLMQELIDLKNEYDLTGDVNVNVENGKRVNEQWEKYHEQIYTSHNVILGDNTHTIMSNAFKSGMYSALYSLLVIKQNSNGTKNFYNEIKSIRKQIKNFEIEISVDNH
jgi:hypothetical protein